MTYTETHLIRFDKPSKRNLRNDVMEGNFTSLSNSVMTKSMSVRGWAMIGDVMRGTDGTYFSRSDNEPPFIYTFHMYAVITFTREDGQKPTANEVPAFLRLLAQRGSSPAFGSWTLTDVDGEKYVMPGDDEMSTAQASAELIGYVDVEIPDDFESNFAHLFGRDAHIARIRAALEAAIMSGWNSRFNCALVGPPGCGKSDICATIKKALGDDAVMEFDATATTAAGAIKELSEREILPRVLIVEEIEKADEKSLNYLMALCDIRSEIRKTTARNTIQRDIRMLVIATVNDLAGFERMASGALASRFANKIGFSRPSRDQLAMILDREVRKINGDPAWIKPALDYAEERDMTDPRQVIALCLCGRDKLVDGTYQKMLAETAL